MIGYQNCLETHMCNEHGIIPATEQSRGQKVKKYTQVPAALLCMKITKILALAEVFAAAALPGCISGPAAVSSTRGSIW